MTTAKLFVAALCAALFVPQAVEVSALRSDQADREYSALCMGELLDARLYCRNGEKVRELALYAFKCEGLDWGFEEADAMRELAWRESRYDPLCTNPVSTSAKLYGFLDSTWKGTRIQKTDDPFLQTLAAVRYVRSRYKTPMEALAFHDLHGYY